MYDDTDFDTDEELSGSDLIKQLRKQINELSKAVKEKDAQIADFYTQSREQEIAEALTEMGVNPKVARFVPDDVEDWSDLENWLGEYGDVFGVQRSSDSGIDMDAESVQAANLMSAVEEGGIDPQVGLDLAARIDQASSPDELMRLLRG